MKSFYNRLYIWTYDKFLKIIDLDIVGCKYSTKSDDSIF